MNRGRIVRNNDPPLPEPSTTKAGNRPKRRTQLVVDTLAASLFLLILKWAI